MSWFKKTSPREFFDSTKTILIAVFIALVFRYSVASPYKIPTGSMIPTQPLTSTGTLRPKQHELSSGIQLDPGTPVHTCHLLTTARTETFSIDLNCDCSPRRDLYTFGIGCDYHAASDAALHDVLECLGETVWQAQRTGGGPDGTLYLECLRRKG